ncbi:unnamed protein product [Cuscuta europaea]|uniref:Uncharacterized protein n=1 Tax=Cuscuta europaea TaxID=41803 RepID=A0A9P1EE93_CUSEU|nr:unnamed protein product [Cuscuta europaea]
MARTWDELPIRHHRHHRLSAPPWPDRRRLHQLLHLPMPQNRKPPFPAPCLDPPLTYPQLAYPAPAPTSPTQPPNPSLRPYVNLAIAVAKHRPPLPSHRDPSTSPHPSSMEEDMVRTWDESDGPYECRSGSGRFVAYLKALARCLDIISNLEEGA